MTIIFLIFAFGNFIREIIDPDTKNRPKNVILPKGNPSKYRLSREL